MTKQAESVDFYSKVDKYVNEKTFFLYVVSCMIIMPVAELASELVGVKFATQPIILSLYGYLGAIMCLLRIVCKVKTNSIKTADIFYITLIVFSAISLIFSTDFQNSVEGWHYDELPAHFLAYYSLMYSAAQVTEHRKRKIILKVFVGLAFFEGIIGLLQTFEIKIQEVFFETTTIQVYGLTQNTNFFGGLSVLFVAVTATSFVLLNNIKAKLVLALFFALSFYCSFNSMARLAWFGDLAVVCFLLVSILIMRKKDADRKVFANNIKSWFIMVIILVLVIVISAFKTDLISERIEKSASEIESSDFDSFGSKRGYIWRVCLQTVPKYWATGIGLDNLRHCFWDMPDWKEGDYSQGKAHNEYIHTLVTQGVFALLNYLILLILSAKRAIKTIVHSSDSEERTVWWIVLAMFTGYVCQAFFNSSIINVAMYFWVVVGMLNPKDKCIAGENE